MTKPSIAEKDVLSQWFGRPALRGQTIWVMTEWGRVTVSCWTHKTKGLRRNDFIMAAKTDALFGGG
jgi:hypothetical protein